MAPRQAILNVVHAAGHVPIHHRHARFGLDRSVDQEDGIHARRATHSHGNHLCRHAEPQTFCVCRADAAAAYQHRHSVHRRRSPFAPMRHSAIAPSSLCLLKWISGADGFRHLTSTTNTQRVASRENVTREWAQNHGLNRVLSRLQRAVG